MWEEPCWYWTYERFIDKEGYAENIDDTNVVVVNTCSFIEAAKKNLLKNLRIHKSRKGSCCWLLAQHFRGAVEEVVKGIVGTGDYHKIAKVLIK